VIDCANSNKPNMPRTGMQGIELVAGELGSAGECAVGVFLEKLIDRRWGGGRAPDRMRPANRV
jgi:hypothetical protein